MSSRAVIHITHTNVSRARDIPLITLRTPAMRRLARIANELRAETQYRLSFDQALDKAIAENPHLYDRYLRERRSAP